MDSFELEPRYSTKEIPGRCLKCLAEDQLNGCLKLLLTDGEEDREVIHKFEALLSFLKSDESKQLRDDSEKYLAEGKQVKVIVDYSNEEPRYSLKIEQS